MRIRAGAGVYEVKRCLAVCRKGSSLAMSSGLLIVHDIIELGFFDPEVSWVLCIYVNKIVFGISFFGMYCHCQGYIC
jgi:hypothetical protein